MNSAQRNPEGRKAFQRERLSAGGKRGGLAQSQKMHACPECGTIVRGNLGRASHARKHTKEALAKATLAEADNKVESGEALEPGKCSPGAEWACKLATGDECHCACLGQNHGMYANAPAAEVAGTIVDSLETMDPGGIGASLVRYGDIDDSALAVTGEGEVDHILDRAPKPVDGAWPNDIDGDLAEQESWYPPDKSDEYPFAGDVDAADREHRARPWEDDEL